jgi:uncharacterized protein (UPF0335 family)
MNRPVVFVERNWGGRECDAKVRIAEFDDVFFASKHVDEGTTFSMSGGKSKAFKRTEPDRYRVKSSLFDADRSGCDSIREVPENLRTEIERLDAEIRELNRQRREVIDEAFRHGSPVKKADVIEAQERRRAQRAEQAERGVGR